MFMNSQVAGKNVLQFIVDSHCHSQTEILLYHFYKIDQNCTLLIRRCINSYWRNVHLTSFTVGQIISRIYCYHTKIIKLPN